MSFVRNACLFAFMCMSWGCTNPPAQDVATEVPDSTEETSTTTTSTTQVSEPTDPDATDGTTTETSDPEPTEPETTTTTSPAETTSSTTTTTTTTTSVADPDPGFPGGIVELPLEGSAQLGAEETIRFASIVEDSRCPTDANCIQAGTLIIQVVYTGSVQESAAVELGEPGAQIGPYVVALVSAPEPLTTFRWAAGDVSQAVGLDIRPSE